MVLAPFAIGLSLVASVAAGSPAVNVQPQTTLANQITNKVTKPDQPTVTMVTVKPGDTLADIASQYQTTYVRLFDANDNIQDPNVIFPGQSLRIPSADEQLPDRPLPAPIVNTPASPQPTVSAPVTVLPAVSSGPVAGCGDNSYANFIYSHESGCRTTAMSPNGCYGIGQACPASKIAYCGADYACQNAFFTAYAGKYGGWAGAYAFWVSHGWW